MDIPREVTLPTPPEMPTMTAEVAIEVVASHEHTISRLSIDDIMRLRGVLIDRFALLPMTDRDNDQLCTDILHNLVTLDVEIQRRLNDPNGLGIQPTPTPIE